MTHPKIQLARWLSRITAAVFCGVLLLGDPVIAQQASPASDPSPIADTVPAADLLTLEQLYQQIEGDGRLDAHELDELVLLLAETDDRVAAWLASAGDAGLPPADAPVWLTDAECKWSIAGPLTLRAARDAALGNRYEETLGWLALREANANKPNEPRASDGQTTAFYYQAVANHQLVRLEEAKTAAEALLALPTTETANRHRRLAELIRRDTGGVDKESLGYVAKLMGDSRRRLNLGRSGTPERQLQQDIIDRLDKVIDELEKEQQEQQKQQQASRNAGQGGAQPLQQSLPAELKGAGEVDGGNTPPSEDWGSLPPAERERVTQQIIRDFPGHYRSLIEEYFRSLSDPPQDAPQREAADR